MPSIPVATPLGYAGVFFVIAGVFLVIAGLDILKIEKLTIATGKKTWGAGLLLAAIGILFLLPDISSAVNTAATPSPTVSPVASNIAHLGKVEVSSVSSEDAGCQSGGKAIDGIIDGYPNKECTEWAPSSGDSKVWIRISFTQPYEISQVILYDRPNQVDHIISGTLEFSDGTKQIVDALPNDGSAKVVLITPPKSVQWVRFTVDQDDTQTGSVRPGLAEIEIMGLPKNP